MLGRGRRQKVVRTKRRRAAAIVRPISAAAGATPAAAVRSNDADPCQNTRTSIGIRNVNGDAIIQYAATARSTEGGDGTDHFSDSAEDESGISSRSSTSSQQRLERPLDDDVAVAIRLRSRRLQQEEMERQMQQQTERMRQRLRRRGAELVAAARAAAADRRARRNEVSGSVVTASSGEGTAGAAAYADAVGLAARGRARADSGALARPGFITPPSETNESSDEKEDDVPNVASGRASSSDTGIKDPASDTQTMLCPVLSGKKRRQHHSDTVSSLRLSVRRREPSCGVDGTANATASSMGPPWSEVEDALLLEAIRTYGFRWPDVSACVGTR